MASNLVPTDGLELAIDALDTVTWYGQCGIGTTNASAGDAGLENITGVPAVGAAATTSQPTSTSMKNVKEIDYVSSLAITECALFNGATGSGTDAILQRHTFAAINVVSSDSIEFSITTTAAAA